GRLAGRDAQPDRTLVKEADFEVVGEWKLHLRPSRAAAAKLAKPLGDVALERMPMRYPGCAAGGMRRVRRNAAWKLNNGRCTSQISAMSSRRASGESWAIAASRW